jgi:acyl carrier protein
MIPSYFVELDKLPLTSNGKVDRKVLPAPEIKAGDDYVAPANATEEKLVAIWSEVLNIPEKEISITSNFFTLGGHSLNIMVLLNKIHKAFSVRIEMREFYLKPILQELSSLITLDRKVIYSSIECSEKREYYSMSSSQERMYVVQRMNPHNKIYDVPFHIHLDKNINNERVINVLKKMYDRHETLRTGIHHVNNKPVQRVFDQVNFEIEIVKNIGEYVISEKFKESFDLSIAPLCKFILADLENEKILYVNMHHIITDAHSLYLFIDEFNTLLSEKEPQLLRLQYKDYSNWYKKNTENGRIEKQREFWLNLFKDKIPILNLPCENLQINTTDGAIRSFNLNEKLTSGIYNLISGESITVYTFMLSVFKIFLSKISDSDDIVVGTPIAGRTHDDLQDIIGVFINTIVLRSFPLREKSFIKYLHELNQVCIEAYDNQEYQYDNLVDELVTIHKCKNRNLFNALFSLKDLRREKSLLNDQCCESNETVSNEAKFDLFLFCESSENRISCSIEYKPSKFKKATIDRFIDFLLEIIEAIIKDKTILIKDINITHKMKVLESRKNDIEFEF